MLKVGCTNLFQFNQSNVCKTEEKAKMVTKMAENLYKQQASFNLTECLYPCAFIKPKFSRNFDIDLLPDKTKQMVNMKFPRFIKTTKNYYAYQELEFLAEFGGYVGLFLGVSVLHVSKAIEKMLVYFTETYF